jgi:hypothetical protein
MLPRGRIALWAAVVLDHSSTENRNNLTGVERSGASVPDGMTKFGAVISGIAGKTIAADYF